MTSVSDQIVSKGPEDKKDPALLEKDMISKAEKKANKIIKDAESKAKELVEKDAIISKAEKKADKIINDAKAKADEIVQKTKKNFDNSVKNISYTDIFLAVASGALQSKYNNARQTAYGIIDVSKEIFKQLQEDLKNG